MRRAVFVVAALFPLAASSLTACFEQPSYVGRLCSEDDPCPGGLICVEQRCSDRLAEPDAAVFFPDAALVLDASAPDVADLPDASISPDAEVFPDAAVVPIQISTRNKHDLVLLSDGTVYAWGWNEHGQIEGDPYTDRREPVKIALRDVVRVAAGGVMSFALTGDGALYSWGRNRSGELGDGNIAIEQSPTPGLVLGLNGAGDLPPVRDLAAGYDFALLLLDDGTVWGFGSNAVFQLGRSDVMSSAFPVQVPGLDHVEKIAAGAYHGVALKDDGTVWAWGYNEYGQLGQGTNMNSIASVVQVHGPNDVGFLSGVLDISAGWGHTIAVVAGNSVYAWGWNASSQLGDGSAVDRAYPGVVLSTSGLGPLSNIAEVRAGFTYNLARTASGDLYAFGFNMYSQLGDGTTATRSLPAPVLLVSGGPIGSISAFAAGGDNAIALTLDHVLWTWGSNVFGEIGDGLMSNIVYPTQRPLPE